MGPCIIIAGYNTAAVRAGATKYLLHIDTGRGGGQFIFIFIIILIIPAVMSCWLRACAPKAYMYNIYIYIYIH
jgi:hypothetical protein